jgi:RecB family endonuclease NucS
MQNKQEQELKAKIEEDEKIIQFYIRYKKEIIKMTSEREWEKEIDESLDILIPLYQLFRNLK